MDKKLMKKEILLYLIANNGDSTLADILKLYNKKEEAIIALKELQKEIKVMVYTDSCYSITTAGKFNLVTPRQYKLTKIQLDLLDLINKHTKITIKDISTITNTNIGTIRSRIDTLYSKGLVTFVGNGYQRVSDNVKLSDIGKCIMDENDNNPIVVLKEQSLKILEIIDDKGACTIKDIQDMRKDGTNRINTKRIIDRLLDTGLIYKSGELSKVYLTTLGTNTAMESIIKEGDLIDYINNSVVTISDSIDLLHDTQFDWVISRLSNLIDKLKSEKDKRYN